jgi:hypothetical protein
LLSAQYAPLSTQLPMVTKPKIPANTALILIVNSQKVPSAKPQTSKYKAITAFISFDTRPAAASPVGEYAVASPRVGNWSNPNESQNTQNRPQTIIGKNCACIQRKIVARSRSTGPVKKKIPLHDISSVQTYFKSHRLAYATAGSPLAPPHPISTIEKVNVAMTNLSSCQCTGSTKEIQSYPRKPKGVAFAYLATFSDA